VSGQQHAPAALYPLERPGTHCRGGWVGPRAGLDGRIYIYNFNGNLYFWHHYKRMFIVNYLLLLVVMKCWCGDKSETCKI